MHKQTPWGMSDTEEQRGEGCIFYSTPSHGGFHVTSKAMLRVNDVLARNFRPWASQRDVCHEWFEEDCDALCVVIGLHERFSELEVYNAVRMEKSEVKRGGTQRISSEFWKTERGTEILSIYEIQKTLSQTLWEAGGMASVRGSEDLWDVMFSKGNERRVVRMSYPMKQFFAESELARFTELERYGVARKEGATA